MLAALLADAGTVVSKQTLMDAVWKDAFVTEASLLEAIRVLRDALGDDRLAPTFVQTVHRRGYRFIAPVERGPGPLPAPLESPTPGSARPPAHGRPTDGASQAPVTGPAADDAAALRSLAWGPHWRPLVAGAVAATAAMIGVAIVFALFGQRPPDARPTMRFTIALPDDTTIDPLRGSVAVSLDGARMVYAAVHGGRPRLFLRTLDRDAPQVIEGSDGAADPFFSPDGEWVGFFAHGSLRKLRVTGGTPVTLCAARAGGGASWGRDGTIVFGGGPRGGLARVSGDGGDPVVLAAPAPGSRDISFGWPDVLPDGSAVLYTAVSLAGSRVALLEVATGASRTLVDAGAFARYSPTGHLVFERRGRLEAAPFTPGERRLRALPRPILHGLATSDAPHAGPRYAFSRTGSLLYVPGASGEVDDRLQWLDVRGRLEPVPLPAAPLGSVDVAPDLRQLAMAVESGSGADLWVGDLQRGAVSRLSSDGGSANPTWRPDGLEIAFAYSKAGPFNLFLRPAHGDAAPQPLLRSDLNQFPTSWSADGRSLLFTEIHPLTGADLWTLDVVTRERRQVLRTPFDETHARYSPDGRWMAYMTNESGRWDVFVRAASGGPRVQVSTDGGAFPAWSVDGRTLYFSASAGTAAVAVQTSPHLTVSAPLVIAARADLQLASGRADADRVLVRSGGATPVRRELRVVLGWFTELARLARLPA